MDLYIYIYFFFSFFVAPAGQDHNHGVRLFPLKKRRGHLLQNPVLYHFADVRQSFLGQPVEGWAYGECFDYVDDLYMPPKKKKNRVGGAVQYSSTNSRVEGNKGGEIKDTVRTMVFKGETEASGKHKVFGAR